MMRYVMAACLVAAGCTPDVGARADGERAVRSTIDQFYVAAQQRDWDAAGALLAPGFEIYTDGAESFDKAAYVALLKQDDLTVERMALTGMTIRLADDGRMAWASFRGSFVMTSHGARHDVDTAETLILSRISDRWLIDRAHASVAARKEP